MKTWNEFCQQSDVFADTARPIESAACIIGKAAYEAIQQDALNEAKRQAAEIAHEGTCLGWPDCGSPICDRNEEIRQEILASIKPTGGS